MTIEFLSKDFSVDSQTSYAYAIMLATIMALVTVLVAMQNGSVVVMLNYFPNFLAEHLPLEN